MEAIFHEKQEGSLCAQHCLNALLQDHLFSPVDLGELAKNLDERERETMAEGGVNTYDYQHFLEQPSSNFDDSGFFSIQVIAEALKVWGLSIVPFSSSDPVAIQARRDPTQLNAYICNFKQHWFTVRKLGHQWFNLNSLLMGPELISDTYLSLFLTQLQQEGYSIFIVMGSLPVCEADQLLRLTPAVQIVKPSLISEAQNNLPSDSEVDDDLQRALEESQHLVDNEDQTLQKALQASMADVPFHLVDTPAPTQEHLRLQRQGFLSRVDTSVASTQAPVEESDEMSEDDMLQMAIAMSMSQTEST